MSLKYEVAGQVMGREGSVEECIEAIEKAQDEPPTPEAW